MEVTIDFVTNEGFDSVKACLIEACQFFQGVPRQILFDNMKTVVLARDVYGLGQHRFHPGLLELANELSFVPKLCRPYRAQTKGKVERFNRYLRESFYNPLASQFKKARLLVDADTANREVTRWLAEVANLRVHATLQQRPADRWYTERSALLPMRQGAVIQACERVPLPVESIQHPLSIYAQLMEVAAWEAPRSA